MLQNEKGLTLIQIPFKENKRLKFKTRPPLQSKIVQRKTKSQLFNKSPQYKIDLQKLDIP